MELNNKKHLQLDVELNDQIQMFNFLKRTTKM